MRIGSLCSGYGGLDLAVEEFFGATPAWFCEYDDAPSRILAHHWPDVPNHGDVNATDWSAVEPIDILTAGYPCQPFSHAGKRKGADDERHLWPGVARAIGDLRPRIVVLENVRGHVSLGLDAVLGDLAALGYDARWGVVRAADAGAAHGRARIFILAYAQGYGRDEGRPEPAGLVGGSDAAVGGDDAAADTGGERRDRPGTAGSTQGSRCGRASTQGLAGTPADPGGERHGCGQDAGTVGRVDREDAGQARQRERSRGESPHRSGTDWGIYAPAVARWAGVVGRPAPAPTELGSNGKPRLSPLFVEWLMGLPVGHVTDPAIGLTRNQQLKALGNGVVPQQAVLALHLLSERTNA